MSTFSDSVLKGLNEYEEHRMKMLEDLGELPCNVPYEMTASEVKAFREGYDDGRVGYVHFCRWGVHSDVTRRAMLEASESRYMGATPDRRWQCTYDEIRAYVWGHQHGENDARDRLDLEVFHSLNEYRQRVVTSTIGTVINRAHLHLGRSPRRQGEKGMVVHSRKGDAERWAQWAQWPTAQLSTDYPHGFSCWLDPSGDLVEFEAESAGPDEEYEHATGDPVEVDSTLRTCAHELSAYLSDVVRLMS